jgi:predicted PurR-regulated permease PerM
MFQSCGVDILCSIFCVFFVIFLNFSESDITKKQIQQLEKQIEVMRDELTKTQKALQKKENDKLEMQVQTF